MSNTKKNNGLKGHQKALFQELKRRFGHKHASDIMEKVNEAVSNDRTPDFMPVKACSEMLELFRGEAQGILKTLKSSRGRWIEGGAKITNLEKRKAEMEFRRIYRLYWVSMKLFYPLYDRALAGYERKTSSYGRPTETSDLKAAA